MRKMVSLWSFVLLFTTTLFATELVWQKDTATAFLEAKSQKKNVLLIMEARHCKWCEKLHNITLADKAVKKRLQKYILVMILRSDKRAMKILPESYYPAPTVFLMKPNKEIIENIIGYYEPEDFLRYLDEMEATE